MTASDHFKQRTGSLGGDQDSRDVEQVIAERDEFERKGKDLCCAYGTALIKIHDLEAALVQKTRECEELKDENSIYFDFNKISDMLAENDALKAQVEQLGRQVAELSKPVTDEEMDAAWKTIARSWKSTDKLPIDKDATNVLIAARTRTK